MAPPVNASWQPLPLEAADFLIEAALREDVGSGDVTTDTLLDPAARAVARMRFREGGVVCGLEIAARVFQKLDPAVTVALERRDGDRVAPGETALTASGSARALLTGERVALNFVQRLSGVATLAARYVEAVRETGAAILDTRKTTPGWRRLEKYAVACGGGRNHRLGLYDMALVKDNHLAALRQETADPVGEAVLRIRQRRPGLKVEVEADTLAQVDAAVRAGADIILLDNMSLEELREAVRRVGGQALTEASGGMQLERVREVAACGVDFISVGALTHSAPALDVGLDFDL
jgi:nicotinate-nucleotide pyrophosphorylase (carboxylating)